MKSLDIRQFYLNHWRMICLYALLFATLLITLMYRLHTLLPGFTDSEVQTYRSSESLKYILHHPVNAPYLILGWFVIKAHTSQPLVYFRELSAWLGMAILAIFCGLLYFWHGHRAALLGTLLFGTSGWFLHVARLGTPDILTFGLLALLACSVWLQTTMSPYATVVLLLLSAGLMYVPGMPWLIGLSIIINWKRLDNFLSRNLALASTGMVAAILLLIPLGWGLYQTPSIGKTLLNLPATGWPHILPTLRHIVGVPLHVFLYGQNVPVLALGHLPVLNVVEATMFVFGTYLYLHHIGLQRFKVLLAMLIGGGIVAGLGGPTTVAILVPILFLIVGAGIAFLLDRWFVVFPVNPLAKGLGVASMTLLVLLVFAYNLRVYFVSWPNASITKANFALADIGSPKTSDTIKR